MAHWEINRDAQGNKIRSSADTGFGGKTLKYQDYEAVLEVALPATTTWGDLHDLSMDLVDSAEDKHHTFIEGFEVDPNGVDVWVITGS